MLDHVTGKCFFKEPATLTTINGVSTQLFGAWLKAEVSGNILFLNPAEERYKMEVGDRQAGENYKRKVDS